MQTTATPNSHASAPAAAAVIPFPLERSAVRRHAIADAEAGRPADVSRFTLGSDAITYELAYQQRMRELDGEVAECA